MNNIKLEDNPYKLKAGQVHLVCRLTDGRSVYGIGFTPGNKDNYYVFNRYIGKVVGSKLEHLSWGRIKKERDNIVTDRDWIPRVRRAGLLVGKNQVLHDLLVLGAYLHTTGEELPQTEDFELIKLITEQKSYQGHSFLVGYLYSTLLMMMYAELHYHNRKGEPTVLGFRVKLLALGQALLTDMPVEKIADYTRNNISRAKFAYTSYLPIFDELLHDPKYRIRTKLLHLPPSI